MKIDISAEEDNLIVSLEGEFDHHYADEFRERVDEELNKGIYKNLILELSKLWFMDSSGLGAILGRYKNLSSKTGGNVKACGLSPQVEKVFELAGLKKLISIYPTLEKTLENRRERRN
ncbi:STAS domain-containing protein [Natranaerofaba carboxydovora]|uniref:STAS domain-containing protein n=1 Tax=Natranaerofaba carboxydovora TaxID=2742683 RepID=UPI001F13152E|nr:anti-sigma factor antagonist [Natranaerofaba carboxydovora]UMZ73921.1 Anti-sigma F factor antagonist [Natranaerofaba carboxydovora]